MIGAPQQDTITGHHTHVVHQHMRNTIGLLLQLTIGPAYARCDETGAIAVARCDVGIEQPRWRSSVAQETAARKLEQEFRLFGQRRQVIARKGIDVGAGHRAQGVEGRTSRSSSRAMINCCTSLAPS